jgi:hypothetical protein
MGKGREPQIILKTDERNVILELGARANSSSSQAVGMRTGSSSRTTHPRSRSKNGHLMKAHLPAGRPPEDATSRRSGWRVTVTVQHQSDVVT